MLRERAIALCYTMLPTSHSDPFCLALSLSFPYCSLPSFVQLPQSIYSATISVCVAQHKDRIQK